MIAYLYPVIPDVNNGFRNHEEHGMNGRNGPTNERSCLRLLHRQGKENPCCQSTYVGIDDFAWKKGHIYMSVVVDHLTGKPVGGIE